MFTMIPASVMAVSSITPPPVTSGLVLWLDAQQLSLANLASVTSWPDASGAGTATVIHGSPQFQTGPINGRKGVRVYDPNYITTAMNFPGDTGGTLISVVRNSSTSASLNLGFGGTDAAADDSWLSYNTAVLYDCNLVKVRNSVSRPLDQTNPYIYMALADATGRVVRHRSSNVISDANVFANPTGQMTGQRIGGSNLHTTLTTYDQIIGEILYYRRRLNSTEITAMEAYLTAKWGIV